MPHINNCYIIYPDIINCMHISVSHVDKRLRGIYSKAGNQALVKSQAIFKTYPPVNSSVTHDIAKTRLLLGI